MSHDYPDALIEQLLREFLGGDRPRDLTERVLARAKAHDRKRTVWWISAAASMAACIALTATLWLIWPKSYPGPQLDGNGVMISTPTPERGTTVATPDDEPAHLTLGGYANVTIGTQSRLVIAGNRFQEKILLQQGHVDVAVVKHKGAFDVAIGPATVSVTGTHFGVDVLENDLTPAGAQRFKVKVVEGSVVVKDGTAGGGTVTLTDGMEEEFPPVAVVDAPTPAPAPAAHTDPHDLSASLMEGTRAGQMFGNRSGIIIERGTLYTPSLTARYPSERPFDTGISRPLQIITANEAELRGWLRRDPAAGAFVLNTNQNANLAERHGVFLLFAEQTPTLPVATIRSMQGTFVRVRWEAGKVVWIHPEPASPAEPTSPNAIPNSRNAG